MTTSTATPSGIGRIFNSPIAGFAPFIIMSLFSSPSSFFYAAGLAVLSAVVIVAVNWQLNHIPAGQLDWAALILFGAMLIVGLADDGAHKWLMENANLMSDIAVLVMTAGGMVIGRPFALMYARLSPKFEDRLAAGQRRLSSLGGSRLPANLTLLVRRLRRPARLPAAYAIRRGQLQHCRLELDHSSRGVGSGNAPDASLLSQTAQRSGLVRPARC